MKAEDEVNAQRELAESADDAEARDNAKASAAQKESALGFYTPIAKGFLTECGVEAASHAIQVHGGVGYVKETGIEQIFRDSRIAPIYEGTTGVQAMDLIGRKMLGDKLAGYTAWTKDVAATATAARDFVDADGGADSCFGWLAKAAGDLDAAVAAITSSVHKVGAVVASGRKSAAMSAATDTLYAVGYALLGQGWLEMATVAAREYKALEDKESEDAKFLLGKVLIGQFYLQRILPRVYGHTAVISSDDTSLIVETHDFFPIR